MEPTNIDPQEIDTQNNNLNQLFINEQDQINSRDNLKKDDIARTQKEYSLQKNLSEAIQNIERLDTENKKADTLLLLSINYIKLIELQKQLLQPHSESVEKLRTIWSMTLKQFQNENLINENSISELEDLFEYSSISLNYGKLNQFLYDKKQELISFDTTRLRSLMDKNLNAIPLLKDQELIIFIGDKGNGKSTTIQYLAGSEMEMVLLNGVVQHIQAKEGKSKASGVISSPFSASVTKNLTSVPISVGKKNYVLLDTPGFNDTEGTVIDVINGVCVIDAIKQSRTVLPIVVISYQNIGARLDGLKILVNLLSMMIIDIEECVENFQFVFTGFPESKIDSFQGRIDEMINEIENDKDEIPNPIFIQFLEAIFKNLKRRRKIYFIDPLNASAQQTIVEDITDVRGIKNPQDYFKCFLSERSQSDLKLQCKTYQKQIMICMNTQQYETATFYLDDLLYLSKSTQENFVLEFYQSCIKECSHLLIRNFEQSKQEFEQFMPHEQQLSQQSIDKFLNNLQKDKEADALKEKHLKPLKEKCEIEIIQSECFLQFIKDQYSIIKSNIMIASAIDKNIIPLLQKAKMFSCNFTEIDSFYQIQDYLFLQLAKTISKFNDCQEICQEKFNLIKDIQKIQFNIEKFLKDDEINLSINNMKTEFDKLISSIYQEAIPFLQEESLNEKEINLVNRSLKQLTLAEQFLSKQKILSEQNTIEKKNDLVLQIDQNLNEKCSQIKQIVIQKEAAQFFQLEQLIKEINIAKNEFEDLNRNTSDQINIALESTYLLIQNLLNYAIISVQSLNQNSNPQVYDQLNKDLNTIQSFEWIDNYRVGTFQQANQQIIEKLMDKIEEFCAQLHQCDFSQGINKNQDVLINLQNVSEATYQIQQCQKLSIMNNITQNNAIDTALEHVKNKLDFLFKEIESFILNIGNLLSNDQIQEGDDENFASKVSKLEGINVKKFDEYFCIINAFKELQKQNSQMASFMQDVVLKASKLNMDLDQFAIKYEKQCSSILSLLIQIINSYLNAQRKKLQGYISPLTDLIRILEPIEKTRILKYYFNQKEGNVSYNMENQLSGLYRSIEEEMFDLQQKDKISELNVKLMVCQEMRIFDEFLKTGSFRDLYRDYSSKLSVKNTDDQQRINKIIEEHKFIELLPIIDEYEVHRDAHNNQNQIKNIKRYLNYSIQGLLSQTKNLVKNTRYRDRLEHSYREEIDKVNQNIRKLKEAKLINEKDSSYISIDIDYEIEQFKNIININLKDHIDEINKRIKTQNFQDAENLYSLILQLRAELGELCEEQTNLEIQQFLENRKLFLDEIIMTYKGNEQSLDGSYKEIEFEQQDLYKILKIRPLEVYTKISQLHHIPEYNQTKIALDDVLSQRYTSYVDRIVGSITLSLQNKLSYLKTIQSCLKHLPDNLEDVITLSISLAQQYLEEEDKERSQNLKNMLENLDSEMIVKYIDKNLNLASSRHEINAIKEHLRNEDQILSQKILEGIKENGLSFNQFSDLKRYSDIHLIQSGKLNSQSQQFKRVKTQINSNFNDALALIQEIQEQEIESIAEGGQLNNSNFDQDSYYDDCQSFNGDGTQTLSKNSRIKQMTTQLIQYFKLYQQDKNILSLYVVRFEIQINEVIKKLEIDIYQKYFSQFIENFNDNNYSLIDHPFSVLKHYSILIKRLSLSIINYQGENNDTLEMKDIDFLKLDFALQIQQPIFDKVNESILYIQNATINSDFDCEKNQVQYFKVLFSNFYDIEKLSKYLPESQLKTVNNKRNEGIKKINNDLKIMENHLQMIGQGVETYEETFLKDFNKNFENLTVFYRFFKNEEFEKVKLNKIKQQVINVCENISSDLKNNTDIKEQVKNLILLQSFGIFVPIIRQNVQEYINLDLKCIKKRQGVRILEVLRSELQNDPYGAMLVNECDQFKGFQTSLFNEKTQKFDIDYVLKNLTARSNDKIDKDYLLKQYKGFEQKYQQLIKSNLNPDKTILKQNILAIAASLNQEFIKTKKTLIERWTESLQTQIVQSMAQIFAILTLSKSENYFDSADLSNQQTFLLKPHAAQVIGIFRMLGMGTFNKEGLVNNLVQIGTGEGKSIVLGVVSCIFGLLGFEVYCACYSEFLSERDKNDFLEIFGILNIQKKIHYGTFSQLCEKSMNNDFELRSIVNDLVLQNQYEYTKEQQKKPQILLIDEVDVFFSTDFFGETYSPITKLQSLEISELLDAIWAQKDAKQKLGYFLNLNEYKIVANKLGSWASLAEETVKDLITALETYKSHQYKIQDGRIGYKNQDSYSFNQTCGYNTLWAYYEEFKEGKVSSEVLRDQKYLMIKCGHLSYAEIPKKFKYILGVTGTLATLTEFQKTTIQENYGIIQYTYLPSVFGDNNLKFNFDKDFMVSRKNDFYNDIVKGIAKNIDYDRAVLVFFEHEKALNKFLNSKQFSYYSPQVIQNKRILNESLNLQEKKDRIKLATISRAVTLCTRVFGRGTDFVQNDIKVKMNGGVHVIQAFFSDDVSEEIQVKGRTARQGENGSFQIIMKQNNVEKVSTKFNDLELQRITYENMNIERNFKYNAFIKNSYKKIEEILPDHISTEQLITAIKNNNQKDAIRILKSFNLGVLRQASTKTCILVDATGSMGSVFSRAKEKIKEMVRRIQEIIQEEFISIEEQEIQIAVFRNYSSGVNNILQYSPWTSKYNELQQFLNQTNVSGGQGNEAIEIGFWHVNYNIEQQNEQVDQIILIGDAPPNTKEEIPLKIAGLDQLFKASKYSSTQHYEQELKKLKDKQVQVHCFYVDQRAKISFESIAQSTGGKSCYLDVNSEKGGENLAQIVCSQILLKIGFNKGLGTKLADKYQKFYVKN